MASDVVHDKKEHLTEKLLNTPRADLASFAEALRAADPKTYRSLFSEDPQGFGLILIDNNIGTPSTTGITYLWLKDNMMVRKSEKEDKYDAWHVSCKYHHKNGDSAVHYARAGTTAPGYYIMQAVEDGTDLEQYVQDWLATSTARANINRAHRMWRSAMINHSKVMNAGTAFMVWGFSKTGEVNITKFKQKMKAAVARFLAGAVEGGEVVKIDDVTSTSVMVNACCDVTVTRPILTPYACVGLGYNVMEAGDSALVAKPAYKVKLGVGVRVARNVTAHIGGYYHQVLSRIKDMKLSVLRLIDDFSPDGRTKDAATASFNMAYSGCEVGLSFAF